MGLMDLTSVDIKESGPNYEKFDVEKNDKALIHIPSGGVVQEFVHVFHREEPTMIDRNGRKVPEWSRESFAGTFVCTGEQQVVMSNPNYGDPTNCPACRAMTKGPRLIERPKRTFAMTVVRYSTVKRSYDLRNNNLDVQIWRHADIRKIEPIQNAARQQPLNTIDFTVDADNSDWKKYMIQPKLGEVTYKQNSDLASNMEQALENVFTVQQLTEACGKVLAPDALEAEVTRLQSEYRLESEQDTDDGDLFAARSVTSTTTTGGNVDITTRTSSDDLIAIEPTDLDGIDKSLFETS